MADLINLNKVRKVRARAEGEAEAVRNRVRFGRAKTETSLSRALREKVMRELEAKKLE